MVEIKSFPLRVTSDWLDKLEEAKGEKESKHEFIINAVNKAMEESDKENYKEEDKWIYH